MGGEPSNENLTGIFFLDTNSISPFAISSLHTGWWLREKSFYNITFTFYLWKIILSKEI